MENKYNYSFNNSNHFKFSIRPFSLFYFIIELSLLIWTFAFSFSYKLNNSLIIGTSWTDNNGNKISYVLSNPIYVLPDSNNKSLVGMINFVKSKYIDLSFTNLNNLHTPDNSNWLLSLPSFNFIDLSFNNSNNKSMFLSLIGLIIQVSYNSTITIFGSLFYWVL